MIATWLIASSTLGIAIIGASLWRDICADIAAFIVERRDAQAENEFSKMTDDELAAVIAAEPGTLRTL